MKLTKKQLQLMIQKEAKKVLNLGIFMNGYDFAVEYAEDIKKSMLYLSCVKKKYNNIDEETFLRIHTRMERYDDEVGLKIDKWVSNKYNTLIQEVVLFAVLNYRINGTEPQFVLEAIKDWYTVVCR